MQKFFIDQHGCAKNQVDGELLSAHLSKSGEWEQTFFAEEADLIVVNSCGFIESAKEESINAVISARNRFPRAKILLAGCLAERYADDLRDSLLEADGFFGNGDLSSIYKVLPPLLSGERPVVRPLQKGVCGGERNMLLSFAGSAFVKITEGCNNRCSFCAIPIIRGELRSRKASEIIDEIRSLVEKGVFEINLIGQDLAAFGTGRNDDVFGNGREHLPTGTPGSDERENQTAQETESALCRLLKEISKIQGEFSVRLLYIHPDHFNPDILPAIKADARILPYFDIPFQSGDDKIIRAMNRTGSAQKYVDIIEKIRSFFPSAAIRTTFLAGFPGEDEKSAKNTLDFLKKIRPDWSGCFPYSREEDTPAYSFQNRVAKKTATARASLISSVQEEITRASLLARVNVEYDVLIEEVLEKNDESPFEGIAIGRAWFQAPEVDGSVVVSFDRTDKNALLAVKSGRLVRVFVSSAGSVDLYGEFVSDSPKNQNIKNKSLLFAQDVF